MFRYSLGAGDYSSLRPAGRKSNSGYCQGGAGGATIAGIGYFAIMEHAMTKPLIERAPTGKKWIDISGQKFGKLQVVKLLGFRGNIAIFACKCECGNEVQAYKNQLMHGRMQSCGCLKITHGASGTPELKAWYSMRDRCLNPESKNYCHYGARGISICDQWINSFEQFLADVGARPSDEHSLGRIDNHGHYEPGNVRWETREQQDRNTRKCRKLEYNGESLTLTEWAKRIGITHQALGLRLRKGESIERILTAPKGAAVTTAGMLRIRRGRPPLSDDAGAPPDNWPEEWAVGNIVHATVDGDAAEFLAALRQAASAKNLKLTARSINNHILFCVSHESDND